MDDRAQSGPWRLLADPLHLLSLGLGAGCLRPAPGTWGTVVGVAVYLAIQHLSLPVYLLLVLVGFLLGIPLCRRTAAQLGGQDHPAIVWDEVIGFLITMIAAPDGWGWLVAGFLLFRVLDVAKPWPIRWCDRNVHGGLGIMLDDAVAGLAGCALVQLISRLAAT